MRALMSQDEQKKNSNVVNFIQSQKKKYKGKFDIKDLSNTNFESKLLRTISKQDYSHLF